jgi:hypothetical protein
LLVLRVLVDLFVFVLGHLGFGFATSEGPFLDIDPHPSYLGFERADQFKSARRSIPAVVG